MKPQSALSAAGDGMNEPGGLDELSAAGRAAWTRRVEECIAEVLTDLGLDSPHRFVLGGSG